MAMKPLKTARDMFYFVEDVMQILGYSKSKSYKVIKSLNRELENQGKCTCDGRVIKRYFHERYGLDELNAVTKYLAAFGVPETHFAVDLTIARGPRLLPAVRPLPCGHGNGPPHSTDD